MEDTYRRERLTADELYSRRNSKEETEIINKIRTELYDLQANPDERLSKLMSMVLNYLKNFWNQILVYRNVGEYSIDNHLWTLFLRRMPTRVHLKGGILKLETYRILLYSILSDRNYSHY